nr:potassium transporter Kef [Myxococcota bacterium]
VLERWLFAAAAGAVSCESTRHALRWVVERHGASGPLSNAIADLARASSLVPPAALSVLFAVMPAAGLEGVSIGARVGITLGIGGLLGLVATLLLGREFRRDESWGILLGTSLLGMGVSERLGLSAVATSFTMGLTVALVSQHRTELKAMIAPTERPVMLPMTVLAGAFVEVDPATFMRWVLAVAIFGRLALELLRGLLLSFVLKAPRGSWVVLGLGMASTGPLSVGCAVAIAARFPDTLGPSALVIAAAGVLAGELVGPLSLRRALERAHEINEDSLIPPPVRPSLDDANRRSLP